MIVSADHDPNTPIKGLVIATHSVLDIIVCKRFAACCSRAANAASITTAYDCHLDYLRNTRGAGLWLMKALVGRGCWREFYIGFAADDTFFSWGSIFVAGLWIEKKMRDRCVGVIVQVEPVKIS